MTTTTHPRGRMSAQQSRRRVDMNALQIEEPTRALGWLQMRAEGKRGERVGVLTRPVVAGPGVAPRWLWVRWLITPATENEPASQELLLVRKGEMPTAGDDYDVRRALVLLGVELTGPSEEIAAECALRIPLAPPI